MRLGAVGVSLSMVSILHCHWACALFRKSVCVHHLDVFEVRTVVCPRSCSLEFLSALVVAEAAVLALQFVDISASSHGW